MDIENEAEGPARYVNRIRRRRDRLVKNIESAQDIRNYNIIEPSNANVHTR